MEQGVGNHYQPLVFTSRETWTTSACLLGIPVHLGKNQAAHLPFFEQRLADVLLHPDLLSAISFFI